MKPINQRSVQKGDVLHYHKNITTTANDVLLSTTSSMDSYFKSKVLQHMMMIIIMCILLFNYLMITARMMINYNKNK